MKDIEKKDENRYQRVITFLTREQVDFLDKIAKDTLFSMGKKLSRAKIISVVVDVLSDLNITGEGLSSKKDLEQRILEAVKDLNHNPPN
ncbi:MAG: hypothetical protein V2A64_04645 [Candidatus Omnitrophota bacterium]